MTPVFAAGTARAADPGPSVTQTGNTTLDSQALFFVSYDGLLVGYLETEDFEAAKAGMEATEVNARWQAEMGEFFESLDGARPDEAMKPLTEVFHLA